MAVLSHLVFGYFGFPCALLIGLKINNCEEDYGQTQLVEELLLMQSIRSISNLGCDKHTAISNYGVQSSQRERVPYLGKTRKLRVMNQL